MNRRLFVLAGVALAGCATLPPVLVAPAEGEVLPELEPVFGVVAGRGGLRVSVASRGCTGRGDWVSYVEDRGGRQAVAFARRRLDPCRSLAAGRTEILFTWRELGLRPGPRLTLLNPVAR
ncbi:hypothetical protein [Phenylobacterium sp.]|uniref:hypothetical protein n=1 Tax=Phenylobacterium sp. TaxID=1871053 RepID=UPI0035AE01DA